MYEGLWRPSVLQMPGHRETKISLLEIDLLDTAGSTRALLPDLEGSEVIQWVWVLDEGLWRPSVLQMPGHRETKISLLEIELLDTAGSTRSLLPDLEGSEVIQWVWVLDEGLWRPSVLQMPGHGETKISLLEIELLDTAGSTRALLPDLEGSEVIQWVWVLEEGLWRPSVLQMPGHGETKISLLEIELLDTAGSTRALLPDLEGSEVIQWVWVLDEG